MLVHSSFPPERREGGRKEENIAWVILPQQEMIPSSLPKERERGKRRERLRKRKKERKRTTRPPSIPQSRPTDQSLQVISRVSMSRDGGQKSLAPKEKKEKEERRERTKEGKEGNDSSPLRLQVTNRALSKV